MVSGARLALSLRPFVRQIRQLFCPDCWSSSLSPTGLSSPFALSCLRPEAVQMMMPKPPLSGKATATASGTKSCATNKIANAQTSDMLCLKNFMASYYPKCRYRQLISVNPTRASCRAHANFCFAKMLRGGGLTGRSAVALSPCWRSSGCGSKFS